MKVEIDSLIAFLRFAFVAISIAHRSVLFVLWYGREEGKAVEGGRTYKEIEKGGRKVNNEEKDAGNGEWKSGREGQIKEAKKR